MNLIPIKCRCGKNVTNFKYNIGPWYIGTCCQIAGYNHLGELQSREGTLVKNPAELQKMTTVRETIVTADFDGNVLSEQEVKPEIMQPKLTTEDITAEVKSTKRTYNRGGNIKT